MPARIMDASVDIEGDLLKAEELLHCCAWEEARGVACRVLTAAATPTELTRAFYVLLQVDFQDNKLTHLEQVARQYNRSLENLPVTVLLLWGVIAAELHEAALARQLLSRYVAANCTVGPALAREDAMALSRLYAVRVLASMCGDAGGARAWLGEGGAGLSKEQQQLLLLEVDDVEGRSSRSASASATPSGGGTPASAGGAGRCAAAAAAAAAASPAPAPAFTMLGEPSWGQEGEEEENGGGDLRGVGAPAASNSVDRKGGATTAAVATTTTSAAAATATTSPNDWLSAPSAWLHSQAAQWWASPIVQDTLHALSMDELSPAQLAACSAAAALLGYSLYRERRSLKRGAARLAAGALATAQMALGFAPDAMSAAPSAAYHSAG